MPVAPYRIHSMWSSLKVNIHYHNADPPDVYGAAPRTYGASTSRAAAVEQNRLEVRFAVSNQRGRGTRLILAARRDPVPASSATMLRMILRTCSAAASALTLTSLRGPSVSKTFCMVSRICLTRR